MMEDDANLIREFVEQRWPDIGSEANLTLTDGRQVVVRVEYDQDSDPFENGDWAGEYARPSRSREDDQRPSNFDGAARKIHTRDGFVWWQPPSDLKSDAENQQKLYDVIHAWFHDEWTYVGVIVTVRGKPCEQCGCRPESGASLWGIESNAGDYFAEVLSDLIAEASEVAA